MLCGARVPEIGLSFAENLCTGVGKVRSWSWKTEIKNWSEYVAGVTVFVSFGLQSDKVEDGQGGVAKSAGHSGKAVSTFR